MSLFFQVLASGSKGNALVVGSDQTRVLLDVGLSARELTRRLETGPVKPRHVDAIMISHEHQDHVRGLGTFSRRFDLPVYLSRGSLESLPSQIGKLPHIQLFQSGNPFKIGNLQIQPFTIPHDAQEPMGFIIEHGGSKLGVCTDLGVATHLVKQRLKGCHGLVLEANHELDLLLNGPYPPHLKQRIRSRHGHLSNQDTCELLETIYHAELQVVILAHLSEVNNHPDLVRQNFQTLRHQNGWSTIRFEIGRQSEAIAPIEL